MGNFIKTFFAALLANLVGGGCLVVFFLMGVAGLIGSIAGGLSNNSEAPQEIRSNTVLKIDIASLSDVVSEDPLSMFSLSNEGKSLSLSAAVKAINKAKNHPDISAIYLNIEGIDAGLPSIDELRRAIQDFQKSKKPVIAYADMYTQKAYYLASVADKVYLNPEGMLELRGLARGAMMYKDAFDKLGVKMEVFRVGTFKSAVEPYSQNRLSEANKQQTKEYLDGLWANITQGIAQGRGLTQEAVEAFANKGLAYSAASVAVEHKLVDSLIYRADIKSLFAQSLQIDERDLRMVGLYDMAMQIDDQPNTASKAVKVLFAEGDITDAVPDYWQASSTIGYDLVDELRKAEEREDIEAVVLRVNSPGGSAFLSEQIWHAVKSLRNKKPIVVSMGDYAASGGYYISAPANMIVAEANTLTGSIGIFGMMPNAESLASKLGLYVDVVKTSEFADMGTGMPFRGLTDAQRMLIQSQVERGYEVFLSRVAEGRGMSKSAVDSVAQGRVWLGQKALELGLVDKLGGLDTAIKEAAKLAKISDYRIEYGDTSKNYFTELFNSSKPTDEFIARVRRAFLSAEERKVLQLVNGTTQYAGIQARLPYDLVAY